jgi:hypothetical protein
MDVPIYDSQGLVDPPRPLRFRALAPTGTRDAEGIMHPSCPSPLSQSAAGRQGPENVSRAARRVHPTPQRL